MYVQIKPIRLEQYLVNAPWNGIGMVAVAFYPFVFGIAYLLTAVLAFAGWQGRIEDRLFWGVWSLGPWALHPLSLLFVLSGSLMISKTLRIPKI